MSSLYRKAIQPPSRLQKIILENPGSHFHHPHLVFTHLSLCPRERENLQSYVDTEHVGTGSSTRCPSAFMSPGQAGSAEQLSSPRQLHQDFNIFKAFFCVYLR